MQKLYIFPNSNSLFNIIKLLNPSTFNIKEQHGFIIQSNYDAKHPIYKHTFTNDTRKITHILNKIEPNELITTRVAYEYALYTALSFPWIKGEQKEIYLFYHDYPNTINYFYNTESLDSFNIIKELQSRDIEVKFIYILNPKPRMKYPIEQYTLNDWRNINDLLINIEDYKHRDTQEYNNLQLLTINEDTNSKDFIQPFYFNSDLYLETNKNETLIYNNIAFKNFTNKKVKEGQHVLYKIRE